MKKYAQLPQYSSKTNNCWPISLSSLMLFGEIHNARTLHQPRKILVLLTSTKVSKAILEHTTFFFTRFNQFWETRTFVYSSIYILHKKSLLKSRRCFYSIWGNILKLKNLSRWVFIYFNNKILLKVCFKINYGYV